MERLTVFEADKATTENVYGTVTTISVYIRRIFTVLFSPPQLQILGLKILGTYRIVIRHCLLFIDLYGICRPCIAL